MKTPTLILLVGPPASGKTTWTREYQSNYPDTVIIGRDKLREMLYGYTEQSVSAHYSHDSFKAREDEVTLMQHTLIRAALESGRSVIVDDTNCDADRIKKFSRDYDRYAFRTVAMTASKEACLARNELRVRRVEDAVIEKLYKRFEGVVGKLFGLDRNEPLHTEVYNTESYLNGAYVFDLDGTTANLDHRKAFGCTDDEILLDKPIEPVLEIARMVSESGYWLVFLSGRDGKHYEATFEWIRQQLPPGMQFVLFMRETGDYRKDSIIKRELFFKHVAPRYHVKAVFDDRKQVKQMWVDMGLFVFDCNQTDCWF